MRLIILAFIALSLTACGTQKFRTISSPPERAETQKQLDNLECSKLSEYHGPWLFGIGTLFYRQLAKSEFKDCMAKRGYVVEAEHTL